MRLIEEAPEGHPVIRGRLRRVLLRRFPYDVYFEGYPWTISVVGVIHGRRHPDTWLGRAAPEQGDASDGPARGPQMIADPLAGRREASVLHRPSAPQRGWVRHPDGPDRPC